MSDIITKQPNSLDEWVTQQIQLVSNTMEERQIAYPSGYAVRNGMMSAMLAIQNAKDSSGKPALQVVKKDSITKFLLEVVQHGLYANKTHFYPVVFGDQLVLLTSYMGEAYKLKQNDKNVKDVFAQVVYEKDKFSYDVRHGYKIITKHEQELENIDNTKIRAAYATVIYKDGTEVSEIMTLDQIKKSWSMGQAKGESKAHKLAPDEMCKKTVIRRIAKMLNAINNDSLFDQAEEIEEDHDSKANQDIIDIGGDDPVCNADDPIVVTDSDMAGDVKEVDELEQLTLDDSAFDL